MPLPACVSNFPDLSEWTAANMTAAANAVRATTDNTVGSAYKLHGVPNCSARIAFDVIPNKGDTATRWILCGQWTAGGQGCCAGYIAGTGIVLTLLYTNAPYPPGAPVVLLADAAITTGKRYHVEMLVVPSPAADANGSIVASVYDENGFFVGGGEKGGNSDWFAFTRVGVHANSALSTISRFAWEPQSGTASGYVPSATTALYCTNDAAGYRYETGVAGDATADFKYRFCTVAVPGTVDSNPLVMLFLHPALPFQAAMPLGGNTFARGQTPLGQYVTRCLRAGMPVIAPHGHARNQAVAQRGYNWGCPEAYQEARLAMAWARTQFGANTRFFIHCWSMGGLLASQLIAKGQEANIIGASFHSSVVDLYAAWSNVAWTSQVELAWNTGTLDEAGAHAVFDEHNAMLLSTENWRGKLLYFVNGVLDVTVLTDTHTGPLMQRFDADSIAYTSRMVPWGDHASGIDVASGSHVLSLLSRVAGNITIPAAENVVTGSGNFGMDATLVPSYPTTATSKAEQRAEDVDAVTAKKAKLMANATILGIAGTLPVDSVLYPAGNYHAPALGIVKDAEPCGVGNAERGTYDPSVEIAAAVAEDTAAVIADLRASIASLTAYVPRPDRPILPGQVFVPTTLDDARGVAVDGGSATLMRRVSDYSGTILTPAMVSAVTYTVYEVSPVDASDRTAVADHTAVALTPAEVLFDTLQVGLPWSVDTVGYNFRHLLDVSQHPAFATPGTEMLVVYTITLASGQPVPVRFQITVR